MASIEIPPAIPRADAAASSVTLSVPLDSTSSTASRVTSEEASHGAACVAPHVALLPGGDWTIWRDVCVRGAGFPAAALSKLSAPASASAADDWLRATQRIVDLQAACKRLRRASRASRSQTLLDDARYAALSASLDDARVQEREARATLERAFEADGRVTSAAVCEAVADPRFREAVLWQNRRAVRTAFDPLLNELASRGAADRAEKERLTASYLQRYCAKNDTIGFFGPVGWARLLDAGPALRLQPGAQLLASRAVHFEGWVIDALARSFEAQPGLRPWIAPRLLPQVRVEETRLYIPGREPVVLAPGHIRLLQLCDGQRPAWRVARAIVSDPASGLASERDVYALLDAFAQMGLVIWALDLPLERDPERGLRALIERIEDRTVRMPCLAALDRLEAGRAAVAGAAGNADVLARALESLDQTFTRLTGVSATRAPGETYASRTVVYEDCRRDATIELGPDFVARLGPPLSLLLDSARWCTWEIARRYRAELASIVASLAPQAQAGRIDLAAVLATGFDLGRKGEMPAPIAELQAELRRRWMQLLGVTPQARRIAYRAADLRAAVARTFDAPSSGWSWARHVSPDVMIAADGPEGLASGRYTIVLGELHLMNTLLQTVLAAEHPDPVALQRALDADLPEPTVVPVHSRETFSERTAVGPRPSRAFWYESSRETAPGPRTAILRTSDLLVESNADGLSIVARDGRARFEAVDFLGYFLALRCVSMFGLLPEAEHMPRVTIDEVVVARERWQVRAGAIDWVSASTPLDRFAGARRWAQALGMPRFAFFKVPVERKPCYLDFDSPVYVDLFARLMRKTAAAGAVGPITVTEMLPAPDQLWLTDAEGRRFTSELRLVAVDSRGRHTRPPDQRKEMP